MVHCCPGCLSHPSILFTPSGPSCSTLGHSPSRSLPHLPPDPHPRLWCSELNQPHTRTSSSPNSGSGSPPQATLPPLTPCSFCLAFDILGQAPTSVGPFYPSKLSYLAGDYVSVGMLSFLHHVQGCFPWMSAHPAWVLAAPPGLPSCVDAHLTPILLQNLLLGSHGSPVLRWTPTMLGHICLSGTDVSRKRSQGKRKTAVGLLVSRNL